MNRDRRKSPDKWIYIIRLLVITCWGLFIAALVVSYYAAPEEQYGLLTYKGIQVRNYWLMPLTNYLYVILWGSACLSILCLVITHFRSRRKSDSKQFNLILLVVTLMAWIVYILTYTS